MSQTSAYPPGTWEGDPGAPWNNYDENKPDESVVMEAIGEARHLADLLETLNIYFDLQPLIKSLEAMTYENE